MLNYIKRSFKKNRNLCKNKKAVSPLIATVLLIGFTVALAGVVITWGGGFVERITAGTEERTDITTTCIGDLNFEIDSVKCPDKITIENKGRVKIESFKLRFFKADGSILGTDAVGGLDKYNINEYTLKKDMPDGTSKVEAIAAVIVEGIEATCADIPKVKQFSPAC